MARFSIVIPMTRPHFIAGALRSVLAQSFTDFEVVISDNSEGNWSPAGDLMDARVRVVRPKGYFTVGKHWDFAFSHATGTWQLMVCDDDALVPDALESIDRALRANPGIQAVRWRHASYQHDGPRSGMVTIPQCSASTHKVAAADVLEEIFDAGAVPGPIKARTPCMPLAACSRDLLERIRQTTGGTIFPSVEPMTSMSMLALAHAEEVLILDQAITLVGSSDDSATGSVRNIGSGPTVFEKTNADSQFKRVPIRSRRIFPAWKGETILELHAHYPKKFGRYSMNWSGFFRNCDEAIEEMRRDGADVSAERRMFQEAFEAQSNAVQRAFLESKQKPQPYQSLAKLRRIAGRVKRRIFSARRAEPRFASIDAAAAHVASVASRGTGRKSA